MEFKKNYLKMLSNTLCDFQEESGLILKKLNFSSY